MKSIRLISFFAAVTFASSCAATTETEKSQSELSQAVVITTEATTHQTTTEAVSSDTTTLHVTTTTEATAAFQTTAETTTTTGETTVTTTTAETTTTTAVITTAETTLSTTESAKEIVYNEFGYGNFLTRKEIYPKPEDETNPTGGYMEYLNIDGKIYRYRYRIMSEDKAAESDIKSIEPFSSDSFFTDAIAPCFADGKVTFEKLRKLPVIGCGNSQYDSIPLEDFRTQDGDMTVYRLSDKAVMTIYESKNGVTEFNFWEKSEKETEFCRIGRLLWNVSDEYEISKVAQNVYMYTEKPDVLEIDAPEEHHEKISGYLKENDVSAELICFSPLSE